MCTKTEIEELQSFEGSSRNKVSQKCRMPRRPRQAYSHSSLPRMNNNRRRPEGRPIAEEFDTKSLGRGTGSGDPCKVS